MAVTRLGLLAILVPGDPDYSGKSAPGESYAAVTRLGLLGILRAGAADYSGKVASEPEPPAAAVAAVPAAVLYANGYALTCGRFRLSRIEGVLIC